MLDEDTMMLHEMLETHGERSELRRRLLEQHRRIQQLALRVAAGVHADDGQGALDEWPAFEDALLRHMNTEELYIVPRFAEVDPAEASRLRDEHATIRGEVGQLGLFLEVHAARKGMFDSLISRLRRHAEREDERLYAWAERTLPERLIDIVTRRLPYP